MAHKKPYIYKRDANGCIRCTSHCLQEGRTIVRITRQRRMTLLYRILWEEKNGAIPKGMLIRHKCDNPACVNLDHLEPGTKADNARDRSLRSRVGKKLTLESSRKIKELYACGMKQKDIAAMFNTTQANVSLVVRGINWNW